MRFLIQTPRSKRVLWCLVLAILLSAFTSGRQALAANTVQLENAKQGSGGWELTNPSLNREIEGYASLTSVNRGGTVHLYVNTGASTYTMDVYRMGWYGGAGARHMLGPIPRAGRIQPQPSADPLGLRECKWTDPFPLSIPASADSSEWASGVYLVKLTAGTGGPQSYIIFTVRDDGRQSDYLFQSSVNTWQAYNVWGGQSLYSFNSEGHVAARKVSFNRPYDRNFGTGDFLGNRTGGWEINMLRFLEREGYDVTYATNVDLHEKGLTLLGPHKAFLSVGHDEYWSYQMKSVTQQARDQGKHLGFFGANNVYWQVRYQPSTSSSLQPNRTLVAYKEAAAGSDPMWLDADRSNDKFVTARFRDLSVPPFNLVDAVSRPENALTGVMYHGDPVDGDIVVFDSTNWIYSDTALSNGSHFIGMLGYETDSLFSNGHTPYAIKKVAESIDPFGYSHMVTYSAPSGGIVFSTGSMQWNWGLDDYNAPALRPSRLDPKAQQTTRNVLARMTTPPVPSPSGLVANKNGASIKLTWKQPTNSGVSNAIYRSSFPGGPYALLATIAGSTSYLDSSVTKKATYFYVVTATAGGIESAPSTEASESSK